MNYKIATYEAHNICGLKDARFDLEGRHLYIVGGQNAQGKTSALNAVRMALCGKQGCDYPEMPLRTGAKDGWIRVDLADDLTKAGLAVELKLSRKRDGGVVEKFRIVDADGQEVPSPRTLLQRLFSLRAFDPLAFERMNRQEKRETLLKLVGVDLSAFKAERDKLYAERTLVGREGKRLTGKLEAMPVHANVPDKEVSIADLVAEKDRRAAVNQHNAAQVAKMTDLEAELTRCQKAVSDLDEQIARLMSQQEAARFKLMAQEAAVQGHKATLAVLEDQDVVSVQQRIAAADETNRKVRENAAWEAVKAEVEQSRDRWEELAAKMLEIDDRQRRALQEAQWPVEGLSFDEDGVLYKGLPIELASKSERIIVSTRIGMALNPRLRLLVSEGGGDLDVPTIEALDEILRENDFQLILELVTRSDEDEQRCAVVIEDGAIKKENE